MALVYFSTGKQNKTKRTTKNRQRENEKGVNKNTKQIIIFFYCNPIVKWMNGSTLLFLLLPSFIEFFPFPCSDFGIS